MAPETRLDKAKITDALEQLQLEETQERVMQMRARKESVRRRLESRENDIRRDNARKKAFEAGCWHKKGGKGVEQLSHGTDQHYAVVKHQLCHGPIIIICQRCFHVAEPPNPAFNTRKATAEQKALYAKQYEEYQMWLNLPTDNEMSGTQLFVVTREEPAA
jgi:hypothetical protein